MFDLWPTLLSGAGITVAVTLGAAVVALVVSFGAGLTMRSHFAPARALASSYIALFRGTSALVQLFWAYFALPFFGIRMEAMTAGILVLGLNTGAYGAEVVRGAIQAVPRQQYDAATVLGFTRRQTMRHVILPQAAPAMIPPFGNLAVELLKNSALVSLITLADLTFQAKDVLRTQYPARSPEIFAMLLISYFVLAQGISFGMRRLEVRLAHGRDHGGVH